MLPVEALADNRNVPKPTLRGALSAKAAAPPEPNSD
jgi:hypothetical protein